MIELDGRPQKNMLAFTYTPFLPASEELGIHVFI